MNDPQKTAIQKDFFAQKNSSIALFGNGVSTQGAVQLLEKLQLSYIIYDENSAKGEFFDVKAAAKHKVAVCSPSFFPEHPWVTLARKAGIQCISELDLASVWCEAKIVGITGTNGKTTTTTFLTECFNQAGIHAWSAGNIGRPLSEVVAVEQLSPADIIFCEVSSFQALTSQWIRFENLIWTNFAPNHLNMHKMLKNYFEAKFRLLQFLENKNAKAFCGDSVFRWAKKLGHNLPPNAYIARNENFSGKDFSNNNSLDENFSDKSTSNGNLRNKHSSDKNLTNENLLDGNFLRDSIFSSYPQKENFPMIEALCHVYNIPDHVVAHCAKTFQAPKYRLEAMGMVEGNEYWNDAKSTTFSSLAGALKHFKNPVIWIGGGRSKGENLNEIIAVLKGKITLALLIGETAPPLEKILRKHHIAAMDVKNIKSALNYIKNACFFGKTIVFSPAFSSFDQFANYMERGKCFEKCIFDLKFSHGRL